MLFFPFRRKTYEKLAGPSDDAESRQRLMDAELGDGPSRVSEETAVPAISSQQKSPTPWTYAGLSLSLVITNIITFSLWVSSLYRMNSWLMEDYYNRPEIEYLGQAQVPVEYETRRFHTGIVAGDRTEFSSPLGTTADVAWDKVVEGKFLS